MRRLDKCFRQRNKSILVRWCVLVLVFSSLTCAEVTAAGYVYPAEWQPHQAIWIGFRTRAEGLIHETVLQEMFKALAPQVRVKVVIEDESLFPEGMAYFSSLGLAPSNFEIVQLTPIDFWFRDPGPLFLRNSDQSLAIADFLYTNYADINPKLASPRAVAYGKIDRIIAQRLHLPLVETTMVIEGGAFEVNGSGTILLTEATADRNPHLSRAQIEAEICRTLGQKKVIWLKRGLAQDPLGLAKISGKFWGRGAGGHTDEFVRFVSQDTVLLAWVEKEDKDLNPVNQINFRRMSENFRILEKATDQDGKRFTIVKMPLPELQTTLMTLEQSDLPYFRRQDPGLQEGDTIIFTAATSYLNYVVTNGILLLPKYGQPGRSEALLKQDEQARLIMQKYFPTRRIVQIDPTSLNYMGGGMHCITQQQPKYRKYKPHFH